MSKTEFYREEDIYEKLVKTHFQLECLLPLCNFWKCSKQFLNYFQFAMQISLKCWMEFLHVSM